MACSLIIFVAMSAVAVADEIAWGDVAADGSLNSRTLDVPVAHARGAENLFEENPMDSYDWSHTSTVRNSLLAEIKAARRDTAKVAKLQEELKPIFTAMPKDSEGRLNNGTARYALHRLFSGKHGWAIKGLQPAGAAWMATLSVSEDVKDITKYMVPTYLQDQLLAQSGMVGFDLHSLAVLATTFDHLINAELKSIVYSAFTTHGLPIPGKKSEQEVNDVLDTFMTVYAFGLNLDASMLQDVQAAKVHLAKSHTGWPQLQAFAQQVKKNTFGRAELNFDEIVQVVMKIGEGYVAWQGRDCSRAKEELRSKPSHHDGRVLVTEIPSAPLAGQRTLFTENFEDLDKLGVMDTSLDREVQELIIPNYLNSQSMCLSTASFYTACCVNECEAILSKLEREVGAPSAQVAQLQRLFSAMSGVGNQSLIGDLAAAADPSSGLIPLHSRGLAGWMSRAFPLECPAPSDHKVTNPKTPDEWMERDDAVADLEEMMSEIAEVLARYTTMGKKTGEVFVAAEDVSDFNTDVIRIHHQAAENVFTGEQNPSYVWQFFALTFRVGSMASMVGLVLLSAKSGLVASGAKKDKEKGSFVKDFV